MAITREKKEEFVELYVEQLNQSQAVVLSEYRGITVQQIQKLRGQMREHNTSVQVVKNTLMRRALEQANMPVPEEYLSGTTAAVFLPDDVATAKGVFRCSQRVDPSKSRELSWKVSGRRGCQEAARAAKPVGRAISVAGHDTSPCQRTGAHARSSGQRAVSYFAGAIARAGAYDPVVRRQGR